MSSVVLVKQRPDEQLELREGLGPHALVAIAGEHQEGGGVGTS